MATFWIVHRDPRQQRALERLVASGGYVVSGGPGDREFLEAPRADIVLLGLGGDFEAELEFAHRTAPRLPGATWILLADPRDLPDAGRLFDTLAAEVIAFPTDGATLRRRLRAALHHRRADALSERHSRDLLAARFSRWFGDFDVPELLRALDPHLAAVPVLIRGEAGTGRGLLAAYIHLFGGSTGGELVRVACLGLDTRELLAEIRAGASREAARRGLTVCLEDVHLLPARTQRRVRNWVEMGLPPQVASAARVRWIATTGEDGALDPPVELDQGLAEALSGLVIRIPTLRERPDVIESFAATTTNAWCGDHGEPPRRFDESALEALRSHPWPGNHRELEGVVKRSLAAGAGDPIRASDLRFEGFEPSAQASGRGLPRAGADGEDSEPETAFEVEFPVLEREEPAMSEPEPAEPAPEPEPEPAPEPEPEPVVVAEPEPTVVATPEAEADEAPADDSLRRLIGAIAHEVRNPLVGIRTFSELLPERFSDPEFRERFREVIGADVRRIERVVDELARFAALERSDGTEGAQGLEAKAVDASAMLDELLDSHRDEIQIRRLVVLKELERNHPAVRGDAAQLRFAFELLLARALELVPERGDVYLASKYHPDGLRGGPAVRFLLRFASPDGLAPSGDVEGVSISENVLEFIVAEAVIRSLGGTLASSAAEHRETVMVIDLPA